MARLLIVCDDVPMAVLLETAFEEHPAVEIIGRAWTVVEAVRIAAQLHPDIVVIASGVVLRQGGVALAEEVYKADPSAVVVVSASSIPENVRRDLLEVCAIPLATEILDLPMVLEDLIPDLRMPIADKTA